MKIRAYILLGSEKDARFAGRIRAYWKKEKLKVPYTLHALSAHKLARRVLDVIEKAEKKKEAHLFIAVAGRSNALGPLIAGHTTAPVINCPPASKAYAAVDVFSSLRTPSGTPCCTVLEPENAALLAAEILALADAALAKALVRSRAARDKALLTADARARKKGLG